MLGVNRLLAALGTVVAVIVAAFLQGRRAGRTREKARALKHANEQWTESDELIRKAQEARRDAERRARGNGLYDDDGHKRPGG